MPTIFERLDASLQDNDLSLRLTVQTGKLGAAGNLVTGLINNPPESLSGLGALINELPLPELGIDPSFVTSLDQIRSAVPSDLSSVTGVLTAGLAAVSESIDSDIAGLLESALQAIRAIYTLTQIDFTCTNGSPPAIMIGPLAFPVPALTNGALVLAAPGDPSSIADATTTLNDVLTLLNSAPSDVEGFLAWLSTATQIFSQEQGFSLPLPVLHEWLDPLQTLQSWKAMQPDEIRQQIGQTLQALSSFIQSTVAAKLSGVTSAMAATVGQLHAAELTTIALDLATGLAQLKSAVDSGDLSGTGATVAQVSAQLDQYEALRATLQPALLAGLPALITSLSTLPDDLAEQMCHLQAVLAPNTSLSLLQHLPEGALQVQTPPTATLEAQFQPLIGWLRRLADQLDLSAVQQPLQQAATSVQSAVDGLDQELANVAVQVRALFAQVEALVDQVDTGALTGQLTTAIENFATVLTNQLTTLFLPVQQALAATIKSIGDSLDAFDPAEIVAALKDAIQKVAGVLKDPAVLSALTNIHSAVDTAAAQLEQLSFAPLTDQVIKAIEEITTALKAIDPSTLNVALQGALTAALAVLPADLTPITDPFVADFGVLVESGPVPLLATMQAQPERLLDNVRKFEPGVLVGNALSQPFQGLLAQMTAFQPVGLLTPVDQELDKLKDRLRHSANPAAALTLLEGPFNTLLQAFDRLSPESVVKPLEEALSTMVDKLLAVLPLDELFAQVDHALDTLQELVAFAQTLVNLVQKGHELLAGFVNAQQQVESWIDAILDKVEAIADTGPLQPHFTALVAALDGSQAAALTTTFADAATPLLTALAALNPQAKLAALVQGVSTFPTAALAALPDSPEKAALSAALARITPLDPAFSAPYRELGLYQQRVTQTQTALQTMLAGWDTRYHSDDGLLHSFRRTGASAAELRQWVQEALEPQFIKPTRLIFGLLEQIAAPVAAFAGIFAAMVTTLQDKLDELLLGPTALGSLRDSLQALVNRLKALNLDFLRQSINEVFATLRSKVAALSPAQLKPAIEAAFTTMLDTITLEQILPPELVPTLTADYTAVVNKLKTLDPGKLVVDIVQPEFESTVNPLLDAFDLSEVFSALLDKLHSLDEELRAEMARINTAYQTMRAAVPSLSLSVDVGVEIGF